MELLIDSDLKDFSDKTEKFLNGDKLIHSFILGIMRRFLEIGKAPQLLVRLVDSDQSLVAAGIQTSLSQALIISNYSEKQASTLAELIAKQGIDLPGVNGPKSAVEAFTKRWVEIHNKKSKLCANLRLFSLQKVKPPLPPKGFPRPAAAEDRNLIFHWLRAFRDEAVPHDPKPSDEDLFKSVDAGISQTQFFVWELEGQAISLVGSRRETANEKWIAPVYTPHNFRGLGYGTALTAYVSQRIVESGKIGMLFTDLANPTSNSIYQKIGYEPISDFLHLAFEE